METIDLKDIEEYIGSPGRIEEFRAIYTQTPKEERKRLALKMGDVRNEASGTFLAAMLAGEKDKDIQKLIRKQLFRLKTMGISVPETRPDGESVLRPMEDTRQHVGFMSNYDAEGTRIVIAAFEARKNAFLFVNAVIHFSDGLTDLKLAPVTRQEFDTIITQYREDPRTLVFAEISSRYAAYLIEESDALLHHYPEEVKELKQFVSTLADKVAEPKDIYNLKTPEGTETPPGPAALLSELFLPFSLSWDTMKEDLATFENFSSSTIVVPPHVMKEKMQDLLHDILEKESLKAKLPLVKRMLEDYAYIFFQTSHFEFFLATLDLLENEKGLSSALAFFVGKSFPSPAEQEPQAETGLIMDPYGKIRR